MSEETTATVEFSDATKEFGDKIVGMTLKEAKELSDYLEEVHGIKPAAGGAVVGIGVLINQPSVILAGVVGAAIGFVLKEKGII